MDFNNPVDVCKAEFWIKSYIETILKNKRSYCLVVKHQGNDTVIEWDQIVRGQNKFEQLKNFTIEDKINLDFALLSLVKIFRGPIWQITNFERQNNFLCMILRATSDEACQVPLADILLS